MCRSQLHIWRPRPVEGVVLIKVAGEDRSATNERWLNPVVQKWRSLDDEVLWISKKVTQNQQMDINSAQNPHFQVP